MLQGHFYISVCNLALQRRKGMTPSLKLPWQTNQIFQVLILISFFFQKFKIFYWIQSCCFIFRCHLEETDQIRKDSQAKMACFEVRALFCQKLQPWFHLGTHLRGGVAALTYSRSNLSLKEDLQQTGVRASVNSYSIGIQDHCFPFMFSLNCFDLEMDDCSLHKRTSLPESNV